MTHFVVLACYIILAAITIRKIFRIKVGSLDFSDGILIGLTYFIVIPLAFILTIGKIEGQGINAPAYEPFIDLGTTFTILLGWTTIILAHEFCRKNPSTTKNFSDLKINTFWKALLIIYIGSSLYSAYRSGLGSEGNHWHASTADAFQDSTIFIIIKNFSGAFRVMIFGLIIYMVNIKKISIRKALLLGAIICAFDMALTFNRIMIVFYLIMSFALLSRYWLALTILISTTIPTIALMSSAWPIFRGIVFDRGFSIESTITAWQTSIKAVQENLIDWSQMLNSIFESSNLVVLNYIHNNLNDEVPILWGYTFLLRPLTTFIPSTLWPDKPRVFGTYLGEIINSHPGLALNSTLFGEALSNFWYLWPLFLFGFIVIFTKIYRYLANHVPGAKSMSFFVGIALWRFDSNFASIGIYACILLLTSWLAIYYLFSSKKPMHALKAIETRT